MAINAKSIGFGDQTITPANPSEGNLKFYFKNGKPYSLDSSGVETEIGSGGSGGSGGSSESTYMLDTLNLIQRYKETDTNMVSSVTVSPESGYKSQRLSLADPYPASFDIDSPNGYPVLPPRAYELPFHCYYSGEEEDPNEEDVFTPYKCVVCSDRPLFRNMGSSAFAIRMYVSGSSYLPEEPMDDEPHIGTEFDIEYSNYDLNDLDGWTPVLYFERNLSEVVVPRIGWGVDQTDDGTPVFWGPDVYSSASGDLPVYYKYQILLEDPITMDLMMVCFSDLPYSEEPFTGRIAIYYIYFDHEETPPFTPSFFTDDYIRDTRLSDFLGFPLLDYIVGSNFDIYDYRLHGGIVSIKTEHSYDETIVKNTVQAKTVSNQNLFWTDSSETVLTTSTTAYPVLQYVYKTRFSFSEHMDHTRGALLHLSDDADDIVLLVNAGAGYSGLYGKVGDEEYYIMQTSRGGLRASSEVISDDTRTFNFGMIYSIVTSFYVQESNRRRIYKNSHVNMADTVDVGTYIGITHPGDFIPTFYRIDARVDNNTIDVTTDMPVGTYNLIQVTAGTLVDVPPEKRYLLNADTFFSWEILSDEINSYFHKNPHGQVSIDFVPHDSIRLGDSTLQSGFDQHGSITLWPFPFPMSTPYSIPGAGHTAFSGFQSIIFHNLQFSGVGFTFVDTYRVLFTDGHLSDSIGNTPDVLITVYNSNLFCTNTFFTTTVTALLIGPGADVYLETVELTVGKVYDMEGGRLCIVDSSCEALNISTYVAGFVSIKDSLGDFPTDLKPHAGYMHVAGYTPYWGAAGTPYSWYDASGTLYTP